MRKRNIGQDDIYRRSKGPINLYTDIKKCLLGASVGPSVALSVANIPTIDLVAAAWVTMLSGNQVAGIGGGMAGDLNKNC